MTAPTDDRTVYVRENPNISLRDYFAGQALAGVSTATEGDGNADKWDKEMLARAAYRLADAMLAERNKGASQ